MRKVVFENYTYFDPNGNPNDEVHPFDKQHFNQLIADRDYLGAADYAEKFHFHNNPEKDKELRNRIINLRRNGRILGALYGRITDETDMQAVSFVDNVFLADGTSSVDTGDWGNSFKQIKEAIGSGEKSANELSITFQPKKQSLFGIDMLMKDNDYNIDNFYEQSGLTEQDLINNGVQVTHQDGRTILRFNKSNDLANKILYNIPHNARGMGDVPLLSLDIAPKIEGIDAKGQVVGSEGGSNLRKFKHIIDEANNIKKSYLGDLMNTQKEYSSTSAPWISDELYQLQQMGLTDDEYNKRAKLVAPNIFKAINDLTSEYEMYTDKFNDDPKIETLKPTTSQQRSELVDLIASTAPKDIQVDAMISNGKIGACITIMGKKDDKTGEVKISPYKIFVPNILVEEAQARINADSSYRAVQEVNSMLDLRYDYKLQDGKTLSINNNGEFELDKKVISRDTAIRTLDKDMLIEEAKAELKYRYMNSSADVFDGEGYESKAREITLNSINSLYPDMNVAYNPTTNSIAIIDQYGEQHSAEDFFNKRIDKDNTQYEVYNRLKDILNIYDSLMNDLTNYLKI